MELQGRMPMSCRHLSVALVQHGFLSSIYFQEPDLDALSRQAAERKRKAEMRHKEALKVQKNQKEMLMKQKTR